MKNKSGSHGTNNDERVRARLVSYAELDPGEDDTPPRPTRPSPRGRAQSARISGDGSRTMPHTVPAIKVEADTLTRFKKKRKTCIGHTRSSIIGELEFILWILVRR